MKHNYVNQIKNEYFVGNTYVIKSTKENKVKQYEVIDGQQRFTTVWLISLCFNSLKVDTELKDYLEIDYDTYKDIRFDFDIRKEVYEYLKGLLDGTSEKRFQDVSDFEFLKNIADGIKTIKSFLNSEISDDKLKQFGDYIYENVKFVFNEAPENTDLNALFVALGTSGIQLQQSDILKARLLDKITEKNQRTIYSKVWEACENMNNYFESNVKDLFIINKDKLEEKDFEKFHNAVFQTNQSGINFENNDNEKSIFEIIKSDVKDIEVDKTKEKNSSCGSIISFNLLLLHTLRIFSRKNELNDLVAFDPKKLLDTFSPETIKQLDVVQFFNLLWEVRYVFDKHIVKWRSEEGEDLSDESKKLILTTLSTELYRQNNSQSNLQILQSVLYFNNIQNQLWLTPFLYFLLKKQSESELTEEVILQELERIDNIMIPGDKKDMSWRIINQIESNPNFEFIKSVLNSSSGVGFNHYWFYKLEYLLWKDWDKKDEKFKRYRITSKNSIEHIFPQNQEYKLQLIDLQDDVDWLNSLGNLALLSVGQNSEYSNHSFTVKKDRFVAKNTYDSLKSAKIFLHSDWNTEEIKTHKKEMLILLENHYS